MRMQLPTLSSSRRSSLKEQVDIGHRIDRCTALAEELLGQAEACLQRPVDIESAPDAVGEHVTLQQRSHRRKRESQADGMTTRSWRLHRDVIGELNMLHPTEVSLPRPPLPRLPPEPVSEQHTQGLNQRKSKIVEGPIGARVMHERKEMDLEQGWQNLANANVDVTWQCAVQ
ncbi:hypothetical protein LTR17_017771 [Elasticomyces elasticus]|nr:hypothetical protein LTR17_017771 [Elasticomyces elasticus]